jgi:hypothetical protein
MNFFRNIQLDSSKRIKLGQGGVEIGLQNQHVFHCMSQNGCSPSTSIKCTTSWQTELNLIIFQSMRGALSPRDHAQINAHILNCAQFNDKMTKRQCLSLHKCSCVMGSPIICLKKENSRFESTL